MYLKCHRRFKDGKEHLDFRIAEKRRCAGGRVVDRHVLYLGEINANQKEAWLRCLGVCRTFIRYVLSSQAKGATW
jgi:hypothetical protein